MRSISIFLLALMAWSGGSCSERQSSSTPSPVLLIGVDGFEWDVLLPLLREGDAPTLAALVNRGVYGLLETTRPTFSPILWTSIATGKSADQHGIRGFVGRQDGGATRRLFTNYDRKTKAFWNILSDYGRSVAIVGWWLTYPAEPVNGVMVSQVNTLDQADRRQGRAILKGRLVADLEGQVYPRQRLEPMLEIHRRVVRDLPELNRQNFGSFAHPLGVLAKRLWENTQWAFLADATYVEIARQIAHEDWDLLALYLGGADVAGHRFWRYMHPESFQHPPSADETDNFGELIAEYYRYVDRAIGSVLDKMPDETTVVIVSDHGMHAVNRGKAFRPDGIPNDLNSGHHRDAPPGVFIAAGPGIERPVAMPAANRLQRSQLDRSASIFDITPTLLALLDIPVGEDMQGRVLEEWLAGDRATVGSVPSHDTPEWLLARAELNARVGVSSDERLEQLRALGYID